MIQREIKVVFLTQTGVYENTFPSHTISIHRQLLEEDSKLERNYNLINHKIIFRYLSFVMPVLLFCIEILDDQ